MQSWIVLWISNLSPRHFSWWLAKYLLAYCRQTTVRGEPGWRVLQSAICHPMSLWSRLGHCAPDPVRTVSDISPDRSLSLSSKMGNILAACCSPSGKGSSQWPVRPVCTLQGGKRRTSWVSAVNLNTPPTSRRLSKVVSNWISFWLEWSLSF